MLFAPSLFPSAVSLLLDADAEPCSSCSALPTLFLCHMFTFSLQLCCYFLCFLFHFAKLLLCYVHAVSLSDLPHGRLGVSQTESWVAEAPAHGANTRFDVCLETRSQANISNGPGDNRIIIDPARGIQDAGNGVSMTVML